MTVNSERVVAANFSEFGLFLLSRVVKGYPLVKTAKTCLSTPFVPTNRPRFSLHSLKINLPTPNQAVGTPF